MRRDTEERIVEELIALRMAVQILATELIAATSDPDAVLDKLRERRGGLVGSRRQAHASAEHLMREVQSGVFSKRRTPVEAAPAWMPERAAE